MACGAPFVVDDLLVGEHEFVLELTLEEEEIGVGLLVRKRARVFKSVLVGVLEEGFSVGG